MKIYLWIIGLVGGSLFWLLRKTKRIEVYGYEKRKFNVEKTGLVLITNHRSLWEPVILPFLLFPWFLFSSKFIPYSLPDWENFYKKWWFWPFRPACVPIKRGDRRAELETIEKILRPMLIKERKILILHAEGTRTFKGIVLRGAKYSLSGKDIARFPQGIRRLFSDADLQILPVWIEGGEKVLPNGPGFNKIIAKIPRIWRKTKIIIGEPFLVKGLPKREIVDFLEDSLLELADKL